MYRRPDPGKAVSDAADEVCRAVTVAGPHPRHHAAWLRQLSAENPTLARALANLLRANGYSLPGELRVR